MATKAINLNEKIPQEEDIDNPAQTLDVADPPPSAQSDHPVNGSDDPPPSNTDVVADGSAKEAGEAKSTVDPVESLVDETGDTVNDMQKKIRRAERFGLPVQLSEQEKRTSRAERFGTGSGPNRSDELDKSEALKRKARAERFGVSVSPVTTDEEAKKKARLTRFNSGAKVDPQEEEKRKARAIRFSNPPLNSGSQVNGEEAIAGKASGGS